jgi:hypothetical protein
MKRRDFLINTALGAGASLPVIGLAKPCPPPSLSAEGGTTATTSCSPTNADADWQERISGPGVVWHHNFDSAAEVDNFRFQGGIGTVPVISQSDGQCRWVSGDGFAGGGCMELNIPTGGTCNSGWWRPFSPLNGAGNGRGANDPGANGSVPVKTYNPNDRNQYNWQLGYYGHNDYRTSSFDGTDFYIQTRVKFSSGRSNPGNPPGKLIYIDVPAGGDQEIVVRSWSEMDYFMYTNFGSRNNAYLWQPQDGGQGPHSSRQPGSQFSGMWKWPVNEWVTMLMHIIPGRRGNPVGDDNVSYGNASTANTGIEVWVARAGATSYTRIWSKLDYVFAFDPMPNAFNVIKCSGYMNSVAATQGWNHRFTQMIFSKNVIPCPQA